MWYFTWILGVGFALACGIINVMWLEHELSFGSRRDDDDGTKG
ncbi:MAG: cytochrome bd-I oxidase subunit CydX [Chromatiales bacterium]